MPWVCERRNSATKLQENKVSVLVMGSNQVGKSTMIDSFKQNKVVIEDELCDNTEDTLVEIIVELMRLEATTEATMRRFIIQTTHAYVLMYSLDDPASFRNIEKIKEEIESIKGEGMPMIIVGNKIDICKRRIGFAVKKKDELRRDGIPHIKVSFADGIHTDEVYKTLFQHKTLQKLTNVVSQINNNHIFSDFRRLSLRADALEETVQQCFGPKSNISKLNINGNTKSPGIFKRLRNLIRKDN